jgi:branched-chain amino acid transport system substrate-binding protein
VGGKKVKFDIVAYDDRSNPAGGVDALQKLIFRDHAKLVFGPIMSSGAVAVKDIANENKVINVTSSTSPIVRGPEYPYLFSFYMGGYEKCVAGFGYFEKVHPEVRRIVGIGPNDESGHADLDVAEKIAPTVGIELILKDFYERGTTDFYPILQRAIAKKPDAILLLTAPVGDCFNMCKQARELGYKGLMGATSGGLDAEAFFKVAGKAGEGFFYNSLPSGKFADPTYNEFAERFRKTYGRYDSWCGSVYVMCQIYEQAVQRANSVEPTKLVPVLTGGKNFKTVIGKVSWGGKAVYGRDSQLVHNVGIGVVRERDGKGVEVCEASIPVEYK